MEKIAETSQSNMALDADQRVADFAGKVLGDIGSAFAVLLSYMGDQTGVFRALRAVGPCSSTMLAKAANVDERYLLEWLSALAAADYVTYHLEDDTFSLNHEQTTVLAHEGHPACMQGLFQQLVAQISTHETAIDVFASGRGRPWGEHHNCCFCGTDRFFRPGYTANLISEWLPRLDGVVEKLEAGARVADVGCGHGSSTVLLAKAFPRSVFYGLDFHQPSISHAQEAAQAENVTGNTHFKMVSAADIEERGLDLVCMFDALHDMGDPVGAARHIRECLAPDGTFMLVEPLAGDSLSENLNLLGQVFYSASTVICAPASRAQPVGLALGAQAGEKRLTAVLREAGFTQIRRATESDANMVLEARP